MFVARRYWWSLLIFEEELDLIDTQKLYILAFTFNIHISIAIEMVITRELKM